MNSTPKAGRRLAVVLSHPTQYYSPWFRWISQNTDIGFRVFYLWDFGVTHQRDPGFGTELKWDVDLLSGYDYEFVPNISPDPGAERFSGFRNPSLGERLSSYRPSAVLIYGYKWESHLRAIAWARISGTPILFRGDSHLIGRGTPSIPKRLLLAALFSQFSAFLFVGAANRDYFRAFGVPERKLFFAPHSVDTTLYDPQRPEVRSASARIREGLNIPAGSKVVLFAGKLVASKQPSELLQAFISLEPGDSATLVFVGDGPEKSGLMRVAGNLGPAVHVRFAPFANQTEMPAYYLAADLFVLPSRGHYETWGLAVNEAMHMGVPCLVSTRVGCQRDLVADGVTGWVFDPDDPEGLNSSLRDSLRALVDSDLTRRIRANVAQCIEHYGYAQTTGGLMESLQSLD